MEKTMMLFAWLATILLPAADRYVAVPLKVTRAGGSVLDDDIEPFPGQHWSRKKDIDALIVLQPDGLPGLLSTAGYANIFYIKDGSGVKRAVDVYFSSADRRWVRRESALNTYPRWPGKDQFVCPGNT